LYLKQVVTIGVYVLVRVAYVIVVSGLLWFVWFGFNAGSAFGAGSLAATALATTSTASGAAALAWSFLDAARGK